MSQVHRPVRRHRGDDLATFAIRQRLHEQVGVSTAHNLTSQYVRVRRLEPLRESLPLLRISHVEAGDSQFFNQLIFAGQRLVAGAHHQRRNGDVRFLRASFRRIRVQYLPVQPAQPLGDVIQRPFLHLPRVGQQQPRDVLRSFRRKAQLSRLAPSAHEQVFLHRRLVDGVALQILLRSHVPRRLNAVMRQLQDALVAPRDDCPLLAPVLHVGQSAGRHLGSHQRWILTV